MNYPTPPSGTSNEASFMRRMVDCLKRTKPKAGPGIRIEETGDGMIISATAQSVNGQRGSEVYLMLVSQMLGFNYFKAKFFDGQNIGNEVYVAKAPHMRLWQDGSGTQPMGELIDGHQITYAPILTYAFDPTGDSNRTATDENANTEIQCAYPRYIDYYSLETAGDFPQYNQAHQSIILVCKPQAGTGMVDGTGSPIIYQEISPARTWAKRYYT